MENIVKVVHGREGGVPCLLPVHIATRSFDVSNKALFCKETLGFTDGRPAHPVSADENLLGGELAFCRPNPRKNLISNKGCHLVIQGQRTLDEFFGYLLMARMIHGIAFPKSKD